MRPGCYQNVARIPFSLLGDESLGWVTLAIPDVPSLLGAFTLSCYNGRQSLKYLSSGNRYSAKQENL